MFDKLKQRFGKSGSKTSDDVTAKTEVADIGLDVKPKKKISPIGLIAGLLLLFLVVDYFMFPADETGVIEVADQDNEMIRKIKAKAAANKAEKEALAKKAAIAEASKAESLDVESNVNLEQQNNVGKTNIEPEMPAESIEENAGLVETISSSSEDEDIDPIDSIDRGSTPLNSPDTVAEKLNEVNEDSSIERDTSPINESTAMLENTDNENEVEDDQTAGRPDIAEAKVKSSVSKNEDQSLASLEADVKNTKNTKDLSYEKPPTFLEDGRGLVYNCQGGHWACVDRASYFQCARHYKWSLLNKEQPKCAIKNVYKTSEGCHTIQTKYTSDSEPTGFCKR